MIIRVGYPLSPMSIEHVDPKITAGYITWRAEGFAEVFASLRRSEEAVAGVGTVFILLSTSLTGSLVVVETVVALLSLMRDTVEGDDGGDELSSPLLRLTLLIVNDVL